MMMKINQLYLALLIILGHATCAAFTDIQDIVIYKTDNALQIIINHSNNGNGRIHYLSSATISYQDQPIHHETWKQQAYPVSIIFFVPNPLQLEGETYTVEIGDLIQVQASCSQGYSSTLNVKVQKAPDVMPHRNESVASDDLLTL